MATLSKKKPNTLFIAQFAILLALEAVFCFTVLGSIPIGPLVATLAMLPVIVAGILLGTGAGAAMGFAAGLFSFIVWTFMPPNPVTAFVFTPAAAPGELLEPGHLLCPPHSHPAWWPAWSISCSADFWTARRARPA